MPKSKKRQSTSSDSDSGPDDKGPVQKKLATSSKPTKSKSNDEETSFLIDKKKFVKVREFRGSIYVDIREYYEKDGELMPSKKGISLTASQYEKLKSLLPEVDEALSQR